jgi:hypothetical protein
MTAFAKHILLLLFQNILHSNHIPRCLHKIQDVPEKCGHTLDKCLIDQNKENCRTNMCPDAS